MRPLAFVILLVSGCGSSSPGTLHLTITDSAGSNVELAPADFPVATGGKDTASGIYNFDAQLDRANGGHRLVILNVHDAPGTAPTASHSFVADPPPLDRGGWMAGHAVVTLTDVTADQQIATWQANGGSVTIVAADGERVALHFDATMEAVQYSDSRGSFHVVGDCTVEHVAEAKFLSAGP